MIKRLLDDLERFLTKRDYKQGPRLIDGPAVNQPTLYPLRAFSAWLEAHEDASLWIYEHVLSHIDHHMRKWKDYEDNYVLPCFAFAEKRGIDLKKLVRQNPGKNCVMLLLEALTQK